jgi:aerobic-type carbon monoxide dehydrogenase small subunit (CoxS/CutS family)
MKRTILLRVNGREEHLQVEDADTLLDVLRDQLRLWSVREGCGVGACGTCTVLLDGRPVSSCFLLAARVEGRQIVTVEGLGQGGTLDPIQQAFIEQRAPQCGYCTPGFILSVKALLEENPNPTDEAIREYLAGNLCRCGSYPDIMRSVRAAQEKRDPD